MRAMLTDFCDKIKNWLNIMVKSNIREIAVKACILAFLCLCSHGKDIVCFMAEAEELPTIEFEDASESDTSKEKDKNDDAKEFDSKSGLSHVVVVTVISMTFVLFLTGGMVLITVAVVKKKKNKRNVDYVRFTYTNTPLRLGDGNFKEQMEQGGNTANTTENIGGFAVQDSEASATRLLWKIVVRFTELNSGRVFEGSFDFSVDNTRLLVGRNNKKGADVILPYPNISSLHCYIEKRGRNYLLKDLNSTNGTKYNGVYATAEILLDDCGILSLGSTEFRLEITDNCN